VTATHAPAAALGALQRTLAGEHAAVFLFGFLGGRASSLPDRLLRDALVSAYDAHLQRRDTLRLMVAAAGGTPVAAAPAYQVPPRVSTRRQVEAAALGVERACATTYAALVAATVGADRRFAVDALMATAVGEAAFGGRAEPLPGTG
jgi:hypothetical protein